MLKKLANNVKEVLMRPMVIAGGVGFCLVAAATFSFFQYQRVQGQLNEFKKDPQALVAEENKGLIAEVGKLVALPDNEDPTIATITDVDRLRDQAFFAKAENGDKILIYTDGKRAILYRPSLEKIIEVAPVNIGQTQANAETQPLRVVVYNGTAKESVVSKVESTINDKSDGFVVSAKQNAAEISYARTIVVDLTGTKADQAGELANVLGAKTSTLPEGEAVPTDADILVIAGSDQE